MASAADLSDAEPAVWRALADPTRRRLMDLLTVRPHNTGQLAQEFPISRIAVMKHLDVLVDAGLVLSRKRGRERWHHVNPAPLVGLHERWTSPLSAGLAAGFQNLQTAVEAPMSSDVRTLEIEIEQTMAAPPQTIFAAVTETPSAWWGPPFVRSDTTGLSIDAVPGGLFVEELESGGLVMARVEGVIENRWLLMRGALHLGAVDSTMDLTLTPEADGQSTVVSLSFKAYGLIDPEMADAFSAGWHELISVRLTQFVEHGVRLGIDAP